MFKTVFLSFAVFSLGAFASVVSVTKGDGRKCYGTFVGHEVVATVAHCLDNFYSGGLRLADGTRSTEVIVDSAVVSGGASNDLDFALVRFPGANAYSISVPDFSPQPTGVVVTVKTGRGVFRENTRGYTSNSTQSHNIFLSTSNQSGLRAGDSGSPLFSATGKYLGALRGCVPNLCGFFSVHSANPVTSRIFAQAYRRGWLQRVSHDVSPSPVKPAPTPQPSVRNFSCRAQCKIEYRRPDSVAYESVSANYVRATGAYQAQSVSRGSLANSCQAFCDYSRDAYICTLTSAPTCH